MEYVCEPYEEFDNYHIFKVMIIIKYVINSNFDKHSF
jgi:hypothetical protein